MNVHDFQTAPSNQASSCNTSRKRRRALPVAVYAFARLRIGVPAYGARRSFFNRFAFRRTRIGE